MKIYHVSGWRQLASHELGSQFTLVPGTQNAEGVGVYFAQAEPRWTAAEGAARAGAPAAVVELEVQEGDPRWWRSKASKTRKFGKPRTWHSDNKRVRCTVVEVSSACGVPVLRCTFEMI